MCKQLEERDICRATYGSLHDIVGSWVCFRDLDRDYTYTWHGINTLVKLNVVMGGYCMHNCPSNLTTNSIIALKNQHLHHTGHWYQEDKGGR